MPQELKCQAVTTAGDPCKSPPRLVDPDSGFCPSHDPANREKIVEAARKGGKATAAKHKRRGLEEDELPPLETPRDAAARLDLIGRAVGTGRLGHNEGRTMTSAVREWLRANEAGEMADRVSGVEEKIDRILEGSGR